jgi:hypothetical protein
MTTPTKIRLRMYKVGFGDCFLLTFDYEKGPRHVLIDFGSTRLPDGVDMKRVAADIEETCGHDPVAIVATHRHKDHISGFAGPTWPSIERLNVARVIQPWTEQPDLARDATGPDDVPGTRAHVRALAKMHERAHEALELLPRLTMLPRAVREEIEFIADDNLGNAEAVKNLASFGDKCQYVHYGTKKPFGAHLPGVKVHVLGPPTLDQTSTIKKYARRSDEYWALSAALPLVDKAIAGTSSSGPPLATRSDRAPLHTEWLRKRLDVTDAERLLGIVRSLDKWMNNTSVILLFEVGEARLLFPGDAQVESWSYALSQPDVREQLKTVSLYKVGHHGSLNATPKSMWKEFARLGSKDDDARLIACLSTLKGAHGEKEHNTEVPRERLVRALKQRSDLRSTLDLKKDELYTDIDVAF